MANVKKPARISTQSVAGGDEKIVPKEDLERSSQAERPVEILEGEKEIGKEAEGLSSKEIQELRQKIEKTDIDDSLKLQASAHAKDIKLLEDDGKIKKLLELAKSKGVIYAINVAKKINDPYVLDMLHDKLVENRYYKKFIR